MAINAGKLFETGKSVVKEAMEDDLTGLAAELSYRFLLAIFPFFIFLAALGGYASDWFNIENPAQRVVDELGDALPSDAASVLEGQLEGVLEEQNPGLLSLGLIGSIFAASGAMNSIIKAFNRAYDVKESRPIYKKMPLAVGLTVLAAIFFIASFVIMIAGQIFAQEIGEAVGAGGATGTVVNILRLPAAAMLLIIAMAFLY